MFPIAVSARRRGPQGAWLLTCLDARDTTQADLAHMLGLSVNQTNAFFSGKEAVPSNYLPRLGELLQLSDAEKNDLALSAEATARHLKLIPIFIASERRGKAKKAEADDLAKYFLCPERVLERYLNFAETCVRKDLAVYPASMRARIIHSHIDAAHRAAHDVQEFLSGRSLFNERNIAIHLCYPHHYYISFFLTEVTTEDGHEVARLQARLVQALEACIDFNRSESLPDVQVAQHALHMLARYRGDPIKPYVKARNPETRRMAYFGEVYRLYDDGPFEELSQLIHSDAEFGNATFQFDAVHYRDRGLGPDKLSIPGNTLMRHLATLGDPRASMRSVAAARVANVMRRLHPTALSGDEFQRHLAAHKGTIEGFSPASQPEKKLAGELLSIAQSQTRGRRK